MWELILVHLATTTVQVWAEIILILLLGVIGGISILSLVWDDIQRWRDKESK